MLKLTKKTPDAVQQARAEIVRMEEIVRDAEAEAQRAATTFAREPTEQSAVQKMVFDQRATNAQEALAELRGKHHALLREAERANQLAELAELRKQIDVSTLLDEDIAKIAHILETCANEVRSTLESAAAKVAERNRKLGHFNALESSVGDRRTADRVTIHGIVATLQDALPAAHRVNHIDGGGAQAIRIDLHQLLSVPPALL